MRASSQKAGDNFLPVIVHADGLRETVHGDPLATRKAAVRYAKLHIADRMADASSRYATAGRSSAMLYDRWRQSGLICRRTRFGQKAQKQM